MANARPRTYANDDAKKGEEEDDSNGQGDPGRPCYNVEAVQEKALYIQPYACDLQESGVNIR